MVQKNNVIDNKKITLKDELVKMLPETKNASIAVGYFFISGLSVIINPLKNVDKVRLLISNTTDKTTADALIEGFHSIKEIQSKIDETNFLNKDRKDEVAKDSKDNIKQLLEYMTQTTAEKNTVEILIEMMKSKQLEVRVYPKEKLHAKAYIFEDRHKKLVEGIGIVGSSNLSFAGLSQNSELNLKTANSNDLEELLNWFNELWKDGLKFTEDFDLILQKSWAGKIYSPYELFLKSIYIEYKDKLEEQHEINPVWSKIFPKLFPFQKNAVDQCITMVELYGGAIIGDVVGLGKTYVGIALLKYLQLNGNRPLIICPPSLIPMWDKFCVDYEVDAKILSRGKLSQNNFELYQNYKYKDRDLVLIDESHHFRNNSSRQYENLYQFMQAQEADAILLTATPFSNVATDIKNQLMLFHQSEKTSIPPANETDLEEYFRAIKKGKGNLTDLLRNIMIRRTRRYVLKQWGKIDENGRQYLQVHNERKYFPERTMETIRYDIDKVYQRKYERIMSYLNATDLTFARYSLGAYLNEEYKDISLYKDLGTAGKKLVGLIRALLLKRMESSLEAFQQSITHYIHTHKIFLKLLDEKIIPIGDVSYKAMYDIAQSDPDSINDPETIDEFRKKIHDAGETRYKFEAFDIESLKKNIQNDIEIFETIDGLIHRITWQTDDKLQRLQKLLKEQYSGKKVLIFSEFSTTAKYLHEHLQWNGVKEQTDASRNNSIVCSRRFDPDNNPSNDPRPTKSEEISLLIATDVLSEGINLQAGQVIINYDFHWNPTRLIQRAGRIDRIGSKNEFVTVHNFLLDPKMEKDFELEKIVDNKIKSIQKIIGEDYEILKKDEKINNEDLYAIYRGDISIIDREEENPLEPSKFEKILRDVQINNPKLWEDFKSIPDGIRSSDDIQSGGKLLIACEYGTKRSGLVRKYYLITPEKKITEILYPKVLEIIESYDKIAHPTISNYDELISLGWNKFVEDTEQIKARASSIRLSKSQRWVIQKLMQIYKNDDILDQKDEIETLQKGYLVPIMKGQLNRELMKIRKNKLSDSELIVILGELYRHYGLDKRVSQNEAEYKSPRILYSKYVGN